MSNNRKHPDIPDIPDSTSRSVGGVLGHILRRFRHQDQVEQEVATSIVVSEPSPPLGSAETHLIRVPKPSRPVNGLRGKAIGGAACGPYGRDASYGPEEWDDRRAGEVCAAIDARVETAVAAIPADHPHRQARLNVLANERGIVASLMAKHDPMLWSWLAGLEYLLERWREWDRDLRK